MEDLRRGKAAPVWEVGGWVGLWGDGLGRREGRTFAGEAVPTEALLVLRGRETEGLGNQEGGEEEEAAGCVYSDGEAGHGLCVLFGCGVVVEG